ncbi:hypothetical protein JL107_18580 [Nakamurella flavida]|uniref:Methylmalonyl-CoA mutase alpha/beta chain catalytic domain-containing protein n=1 Tax=Nakamurella flavida TaxID=363630 RepID=A0A938YIS7_9ACTN|nr:methylmalonyl-CoA mutase family protein [Nakamurella flavida]MBM9478461.1 hypothetical protein [Nakamurella flavida]MDP9777713.1 methylmalonyl-CoA mutase [Nakamurella flavida]
MDPTAAQPPAVDGPYPAWLAAAAVVLQRGGTRPVDPVDVPALLGSTTVEGLAVPPLGAPGGPTPLGPATARTTAGWDIRSLVAATDAHAAGVAAITDLQHGATSLWWAVGGAGTAPGDLAPALDGVWLDAAPVVLLAGGDTTDLTAARALAAVLIRSGVTPAPGTGLGADPVGRALLDGRSDPGADVGALIELAGALGVGAFVADGSVAHRRGAGDAATLGYTLAAGTSYLRELVDAGVPTAQAFSMLQVRLAVSDEQFVGTATLRAARRLWARIGEIVGVDPWAAGLTLHAVTSWPMMTAIDPWVNLVRTTVAAFAAAVGGAHAVTVLPFDLPLGAPDQLGRRMAVAQSLVLMREAQVGQVQDPTAGAVALEQLTDTLAVAGWAEFQRLEEAGGVVDALQNGVLDGGFAAARSERSRRLATRSRPITGVSEFPTTDPTPARSPGGGVFDRAERWSVPFEDLRAAPPATVAVLDLGGSPARRSWIENLLQVGGLETRLPTGDDPVAVLVGSDEHCAEHAGRRIGELRAAGTGWIALAGRPTPGLGALLDDHVAPGADVLAFLHRTRDALHADAGTPR